MLDVLGLDCVAWFSELLGFSVVSESSASKLIDVFLGSSVFIFFDNFGASLLFSVVLRLEQRSYLEFD